MNITSTIPTNNFNINKSFSSRSDAISAALIDARAVGSVVAEKQIPGEHPNQIFTIKIYYTHAPYKYKNETDDIDDVQRFVALEEHPGGHPSKQVVQSHCHIRPLEFKQGQAAQAFINETRCVAFKSSYRKGKWYPSNNEGKAFLVDRQGSVPGCYKHYFW